ncbi:MAG: FMN-binding protein, partial [Gammaproteobacteria bacterium]
MNLNRLTTFLICCLLLAVSQQASFASDDFIAPEEFLQRVFAGDAPGSNTLWLTGEKKVAATDILGHDPGFLRMRYWGDAQRSAWVVDEIGKTEPITIGIVVSGNAIESVEVLAFRESRGWEIKYDFFKRQFFGAALTPNLSLNQDIDGISGATLSVRAMTNVSRLV